MTKNELSKALELARSDTELPPMLGPEATDLFDGFALESFSVVYCTMRQLAALIRYQCIMLNGGLDSEALNEIATHGKRKFMVV